MTLNIQNSRNYQNECHNCVSTVALSFCSLWINNYKGHGSHLLILVSPLVGTVWSIPSTNTYLSSASAVGDQVVSTDAEDNVAKVDFSSLAYLWKFNQYFFSSL